VFLGCAFVFGRKRKKGGGGAVRGGKSGRGARRPSAMRVDPSFFRSGEKKKKKRKKKKKKKKTEKKKKKKKGKEKRGRAAGISAHSSNRLGRGKEKKRREKEALVERGKTALVRKGEERIDCPSTYVRVRTRGPLRKEKKGEKRGTRPSFGRVSQGKEKRRRQQYLLFPSPRASGVRGGGKEGARRR